jgi:hypothetical protein
MNRTKPCFRLYAAALTLAVSLSAPVVARARPRQAAPPAAAGATVESLILLRHTTPKQIIPLLMRTPKKGAPATLPEGIAAVAPYDDKPALKVRGTAEGIELLRGLVSLLDAEPQQVRLRVRVVRTQFTPGGGQREAAVVERTGTVVANHPFSVSIPPESGRTFVLRVTPRLTDAAGTAALIAKFGVLWEDGTNSGFERATTVPLGRATRITGLTNAKPQKTAEEIALGRVPARWSGAAFVAYYVEVRPDEVKKP